MIKSQHGKYHPAQLGIVLGLIMIAIGWFAYNYITKDTEISCNDLKAMTLIISDDSGTIQKIHDINCQSPSNNDNKIKITGEEFDKIKESTSELDIKAPYVLEKYSTNKEISTFRTAISELVKKGEFHKAIDDYANRNKKRMNDLLSKKDSPFFRIRNSGLSISKEVLPNGLWATYETYCDYESQFFSTKCIEEIVLKDGTSKEFKSGSIDDLAESTIFPPFKQLKLEFAYPNEEQCYLFANKDEAYEKLNTKCAIPIKSNSNYYLYLIRREPPP